MSMRLKIQAAGFVLLKAGRQFLTLFFGGQLPRRLLLPPRLFGVLPFLSLLALLRLALGLLQRLPLTFLSRLLPLQGQIRFTPKGLLHLKALGLCIFTIYIINYFIVSLLLLQPLTRQFSQFVLALLDVTGGLRAHPLRFAIILTFLPATFAILPNEVLFLGALALSVLR